MFPTTVAETQTKLHLIPIPIPLLDINGKADEASRQMAAGQHHSIQTYAYPGKKDHLVTSQQQMA